LILDEPASGLDPKLRIELKNLLLDLKKKWVTIFVSSHILNELSEYCDSIIFIEWGVIKKSWNILELSKKKNSETKVIQIKSSDFKKVEEILKENKIKFSEIEHQNNLEEIYLDVMK
jgi:ABC-2 type transport system ATP-binding protein